jgi:uncharacterized protein YyaL (SSP411 family)
VDWYPWGEEAFWKAKEEDKPIFLSIGYATCHWCHVMEHESFEDEEVAGLLNENVISVKVDREERPDVDHIYMTVCQALTGSGGWPLSIFMTPDRKPFFAGTYFPKSGRMGTAGFTDIIRQIAQLWANDRQRLFEAGEGITAAVQPRKQTGRGRTLGMETLEAAYRQLRHSFDHQWGGFGAAPKFPTPHHLTFLLRWHQRAPRSEALSIVKKTLDAMRNGGLFDQVGFGFHRYSVDERWLVPHFEKMLYDQAMLAMAYIEAFQVTGEESYARVSREIFEYVSRDMTSPEGAFYSAEDADSEGEEGLFYVWTPGEIESILGKEAGALFCRFYDITPPGNFEHGKSIPHISKSPAVFAQMVGMEREELERALEESRQKLFAAREKRIHPLKDDKILTSWNGLMMVALAKGYQALRDPAYLSAASRAADFVLEKLREDSGRLRRRYRLGSVAHPGCLDDYAFLAWGLIELYESSFEVRYLREAIEITRLMLDLFEDREEGGFFYTARDSEKLIIRDKEIYDGAIPSSNSVALLNLLRLARMTGNTEWEEKADRLLKGFSELVGDYSSAYTQFLNGVDFALGPAREIIIAGDPDQEITVRMVELLHKKFSPNRILMLRETGEGGNALTALCDYVKPLHPINHQPVVYICENFACKTPVTDPAELA